MIVPASLGLARAGWLGSAHRASASGLTTLPPAPAGTVLPFPFNARRRPRGNSPHPSPQRFARPRAAPRRPGAAPALLIVGLPWIGYAAKAGGARVVLWLLAIPLFFLPLAGTVVYLSRRMPLEGGVYQ
jgi:hypothetical protein